MYVACQRCHSAHTNIPQLLLEIADEFIDSVANFACRLAKHRNSSIVDIKDLQLHLEMHHGIRIPGFTVDASTGGHASTATAGGQAGEGKEGASKPSGSGKKGANATAAAAALKRSARLTAVTMAKKEARLL